MAAFMSRCLFHHYRGILNNLSISKLLLTYTKFNVNSMATATVIVYDGEQHLNISFRYGDSVIPERQFNFRRETNEAIRDSFNRISANINKCYDKKRRKLDKKRDSTTPIVEIELPEIRMLRNDQLLSCDVVNAEAWNEHTVLKIGRIDYKIEVNPPTVQSLKIPSAIMAGFPVFPYVNLDFGNLVDSRFVWYKSEKSYDEQTAAKKKLPLDSNIKWVPLTIGLIYYVKNTDIGHLLRVICYPKLGNREGKQCETVGQDIVGAGPGICPYHVRHELTKEKTDCDHFRVVTYNVLADCYADQDYSREHLFSHCPTHALTWGYRKQLILNELSGYNSDIICMQEVDKKAYDNEFKLFLESAGFVGTFDSKGEQMHEGLACFFNSSKFRLLNKNVVNCGKEVQRNPNMAYILEKVIENEKLSERFLDRSTILQVTELETLHDNKKRLLVANTHLYFHPNADHIRLLQTAVCALYIQEILTLKSLQNPDCVYSLIFCGDFNSCPEFGVHQLLTSQLVADDSDDWKSCPGEEVHNLNVSHTLNLESAYGCPVYTNYTLLFSGCLDYIFYDTNHLKLKTNVPLPNHEEVTLYKAIPNIVFPSDHLSLISEFSWKDR